MLDSCNKAHGLNGLRRSPHPSDSALTAARCTVEARGRRDCKGARHAEPPPGRSAAWAADTASGGVTARLRDVPGVEKVVADASTNLILLTGFDE